MKRYPVFIVGAGRSGTTMFRLMLNSHPNIYIPPEAWFFGELLFKFSNKKVLSIDDVNSARSIITSNVRWPDWNCSNEKLDVALDFKSPPTIRELIESVFLIAQSLVTKKSGVKKVLDTHISLVKCLKYFRMKNLFMLFAMVAIPVYQFIIADGGIDPFLVFASIGVHV